MAPRLPDIQTLIQAGINPKNGLPYKYNDSCNLKDEIRKSLRILDEQNAIRRFKWFNLPNGLDTELIERVMYYKGQGMFFLNQLDDKFYFLPYCLEGQIDLYGRFLGVKPLPFNGSTKSDKSSDTSPLDIFHRTPVYSIEDILNGTINDPCVLLHDYSLQISQTNIPRQILQEPILDAMAEAFPMARTALIANSGIRAMRVPDQSSEANVNIAAQSMTNAALTGKPLIPIVGNIDFQDLTNGTALKSEEYLLYMQAMDNYRLSLYGLGSGGLFQKQAHMLEAEADMNAAKVKSALEDALILREAFCDKVNLIWGLNIWCEASESAIETDMDGDGVAMDELDQSGTMDGDQPQTIPEGGEND